MGCPAVETRGELDRNGDFPQPDRFLGRYPIRGPTALGRGRDHLKLYATSLVRSLDDGWFRTLLDDVPSPKKERILKFRRREDALRTLIGDRLLRQVLSEETGVPTAALALAEEESGKPVLAGRDDLFFNISHSGSWVVCVTDDRPVGVDIEEVRSINLAVSRVWMSRDERKALQLTPEASRQALFYRLWTMKESYAKADGSGLRRRFDQFSVSELEARDEAFFKDYDVAPGYATAVCATHEAFADSIDRRPLEDLVPGLRTGVPS